MSKIIAVRDPDHAPCGWLVRENGRDRLVDSDWDFPGLARNWGFVPCECGATDGTVDCPHKKAGEMISAAWDFLEEHGTTPIEDPGYFT